MRGRHRRVSRGTSQRRQLVWARSNNLSTGEVRTSGASVTNLLSSYETETGADVTASTVMAIRGRIFPTREGGASAVSTALAWGIIVAPRSITTPGDYDPQGLGQYLDWMARGYAFFPAPTPGATTQIFPPGQAVTYDEINIRSRRKFKEVGETLYLVASRPAVGPYNTGLFWALDILLALP